METEAGSVVGSRPSSEPGGAVTSASGRSPDPATIRQLYDVALGAWQEAGRAGRPRFVMGLFWGLGPDAAERGGAYLRDYYAWLGPMADMIASRCMLSASPGTRSIGCRAIRLLGHC